MKKAYAIVGGVAICSLAAVLITTTHMSDILPTESTKVEIEPSIMVKADDVTNGAMLSAEAEKQQAPKAEEAMEGDVAGYASPAPATLMAEPGAPVAAEMKVKRMQKSAPLVMQQENFASDMVMGRAAGSRIGGKESLNERRIGIMPQPVPVPSDASPVYYQDEGRDKFEDFEVSPVKAVAEEPVSTFSIDVDTASYSFMRSSLNNNVLPQKNAVRIEEMINYFPYEYEAPKTKETPFKANVSVFPTPWNKETKLMHIGIKGYQLENAEKPHSNLVFLIDTSGSMNDPNKLPLLKNSFKLLLDSLDKDDTVAIVTYAGSAGTALEPTSASEKVKILAALENLSAGGSTAGAEGIRQAYNLAEQNFDKEGVNRVILATDGDFNVGITDHEELKSYIERKRDSGVFLSVLGFGRGNYNDQMMQTLAQNGNGTAAYIDTLSEARKVLVEEAGSTLFPIAKDVKIQVEFNPAVVSEYRLIGYETRVLAREDFNNDKVDAGDIGAGHTVTAIYELTPAGSEAEKIDDLRYQKKDEAKPVKAGNTDEYAFVKIRYKLPKESKSKLITTPVTKKAEYATLAEVPQEARFASSVAAFGQLLKGGKHTGEFGYDDVIDQAQKAKGDDAFGYRAEFINLVRIAKTASALQSQR